MVPLKASYVLENDELVKALRKAGVIINDIWDLVNSPSTDEAAIPVLVEFLPRCADLGVKEGIVRALSVTHSRKQALGPVLHEFLARPVEEDGRLKWAIGNALYVLADKSVLEDLISIAEERRHGQSRQMVVLKLGYLRDRRALPTIIRLLSDDDVALHALTGVKLMKAVEARDEVAKLLSHSHPTLRKEAKKTLDRLDEIAAELPRTGRKIPPKSNP